MQNINEHITVVNIQKKLPCICREASNVISEVLNAGDIEEGFFVLINAVVDKIVLLVVKVVLLEDVTVEISSFVVLAAVDVVKFMNLELILVVVLVLIV